MALSLHFRPATMADASKLLQWRNDVLTRKFSLNSETITEQQHRVWLNDSLNNPQRQLYIVELDKQPIGTTRVDSEHNQHTISWTLAPEFRGKGLAKAMVAQLVNGLAGKISAEILPANTASVCVAEYAGLTYDKTENGIMYYISTV